MKQFSLLTFVAIPVKLDITIVEIEGTKMGSILFDGCPLLVFFNFWTISWWNYPSHCKDRSNHCLHCLIIKRTCANGQRVMN